jgi:hypothetical protein
VKELLIVILLAGGVYFFMHSQDLQTRLNDAADENTKLTDRVQLLSTQMKTLQAHEGPAGKQFFTDPFNPSNSGGNPLDAATLNGNTNLNGGQRGR